MITYERLQELEEGEWCTVNLRGAVNKYVDFDELPCGEKTVFDADYGTFTVYKDTGSYPWWISFNPEGIEDYAYQKSGEHAPEGNLRYVDWDNELVYIDVAAEFGGGQSHICMGIEDALAALCLYENYEWQLNTGHLYGQWDES